MNLLFENHEVDKSKIKRVMDLYSHDSENKKNTLRERYVSRFKKTYGRGHTNL